MKSAACASAVLVVTAIVGWVFQSHPYRLDRVGEPTDQAALAHRDSAYASSTWVASEAGNVMELRFFDRVEGGVCLRPTWDDIQALAKTHPSLAHLCSDTVVVPAKPDVMWPYDWQPNPGTLPHTRYVCMFPAAVLLNDRLMANGATEAPANICVVGLGSGVGIATYAHHFPQSSIVVVDIDSTVIDMVREYFPLLRWLETQKTDDGRPRLQFIALDARQYIQEHAEQKLAPFDVVILDAYTSGSTIPPHLMTREFYAECKAAMSDDGILMSNIISSYEPTSIGSSKHFVLGGALRSMMEAGLTHAHNIPILRGPDQFNRAELRNNIAMASANPLSPQEHAAGWERLRTFVPFPELTTGLPDYTSRTVALSDGTAYTSAAVPADLLDLRIPGIRGRMKANTTALFGTRYDSTDPALIGQVIDEVGKAYSKQKKSIPAGWDNPRGTKLMIYVQVDWVAHARLVWNSSLKISRTPNEHDGKSLIGDATTPGFIAGSPLFTDARPNADIYNTGN